MRFGVTFVPILAELMEPHPRRGSLAVGCSTGGSQQLILLKAAGLPGLGWDEGPGNLTQPPEKCGGASCSEGGIVGGSQTGQG